MRKILSYFVLFKLNNIPTPELDSQMPICQECGVNFPLLTESDVCRKCRMLEGKSSVEKTVIKASCLVYCQVGI
jgi:hypothetical protein